MFHISAGSRCSNIPQTQEGAAAQLNLASERFWLFTAAACWAFSTLHNTQTGLREVYTMKPGVIYSEMRKTLIWCQFVSLWSDATVFVHWGTQSVSSLQIISQVCCCFSLLWCSDLRGGAHRERRPAAGQQHRVRRLRPLWQRHPGGPQHGRRGQLLHARSCEYCGHRFPHLHRAPRDVTWRALFSHGSLCQW